MGAPITCKLLDEKGKRLRALLGHVKLTLLYKAAVHGYKASAFHQRCDRRGPTLLVAYNHSGYIFGGYTSVEYARSGQHIIDREAFLFSFQGMTLEGPNFGQQLYFCYNNQPVVLNHRGTAFSVNTGTMYENDTQLMECEVYKVKQIPQSSAINKQWRNVLWTANRRAQLMALIRNYKSLITSVNQVRILMIGPVGAGKSSFFNSIFVGRMTSKAMSGSAATSLTTQFRTYPVVDHHDGTLLPFVLCDTMGLKEQSGAGLDIEDISSILYGHVPDRYKFNPMTPFQHNERRVYRPASLQEKIHCVVYVIDATKISLMSTKIEEKLASIRRRVNLLNIPQIVLMTKVDEACPLVQKDLQSLYVSSYIKSKVQEVSSRLGLVCYR